MILKHLKGWIALCNEIVVFLNVVLITTESFCFIVVKFDAMSVTCEMFLIAAVITVSLPALTTSVAHSDRSSEPGRLITMLLQLAYIRPI